MLASSAPFVVMGQVVECPDTGQEVDEVLDVPTNEGLSTGQADLPDPESDTDLDDPRDLLERQELATRSRNWNSRPKTSFGMQ